MNKKLNEFLKTYTKILIWSFFFVIMMNAIILTTNNVCYEVATPFQISISEITDLPASSSGCELVTEQELKDQRAFFNKKFLLGAGCLVGIIVIRIIQKYNAEKREVKK